MKILSTLVFLIAAQSAFAVDLSCKVSRHLETPAGSFDTVTITQVESYEEVSADLPDQSTTDGFSLSPDKKLQSAVFSNECDNTYSVSFSNSDFAALLAGRVTVLKGSLTVEYLTDDGDESLEAELNCTVINQKTNLIQY